MKTVETEVGAILAGTISAITQRSIFNRLGGLAARPIQQLTAQDRLAIMAELESSVWADVVVGPNSVYQSIAQLRRALGDDRAAPRYIETIPRKGYRLMVPVEPLAAGEHTSPAGTTVASRLRPPRWATIGALLALVLIGLGYLLIPGTLRDRLLPPRAEERSIAVLPTRSSSSARSATRTTPAALSAAVRDVCLISRTVTCISWSAAAWVAIIAVCASADAVR